jgi:DNA polymerase I-like protein with 3'-5' exonuclease and polymerase domains
MKLTLDVENTVNKRDGKMHLDPYEPGNTLVQVGTQNADNPEEKHIFTFDHTEKKDTGGTQRKQLQLILDNTTLMIGHNLQHDLQWIWECGFKYDGAIYDTMLAEYLLLRGQKDPLSLDACAQRRGLGFQKDDTLKTYFKEGFNTNEIPLKELSFYLERDLDTTTELYHSIEADFAKPESASLAAVKRVTFDTCKVLTKIYMRGIKVDKPALELVRKQFEEEKNGILQRLSAKTKDLMGATPVNLNSPEQVSQVVFSRKVNNKKEWVDLFNHTPTDKEFRNAVDANSTIIRKTRASTCPECNGEGKVYKLKKDGTRYAKPNKCRNCDTRGYVLNALNEVAGLKFSAPSKTWVSANGFSTGKDNLDLLMATAKTKGMDDAVAFLKDLKRLSAVSSYLSSFVDGIDTYTKPDGFLHVSLTQHITATARFSGRNPNMQNMPRGGTFPVKRVFISRWEGGQIMEADFAQLEFRAAAFLSQDVLAMQEISTGFDVHSYTAKVITDAGQPTSRQEAKEHTFAPLFGATGYGRSKAEEAYYIHFTQKYEGIAAWHKKLGNEAIRFNKITNVSGRQYAFPDVTRRANGSVTHFTMIKNYPVQGFATGDVVPVVLIELEKQLSSMHSCIVNTVHDSMVIDIHPDEVEKVKQLIEEMNGGLNDLIEKYYDVTMNVPLLLEAKMGPNWLDVKDV